MTNSYCFQARAFIPAYLCAHLLEIKDTLSASKTARKVMHTDRFHSGVSGERKMREKGILCYWEPLKE